MFESDHEQLDSVGLASNGTVVKEEGFEVDASGVPRFREPRGFKDEWPVQEEKARGGFPDEPLSGCESARCPLAGWSHDGSTRQLKESTTGSVSGLPHIRPCLDLNLDRLQDGAN